MKTNRNLSPVHPLIPSLLVMLALLLGCSGTEWPTDPGPSAAGAPQAATASSSWAGKLSTTDGIAVEFDLSRFDPVPEGPDYVENEVLVVLTDAAEEAVGAAFFDEWPVRIIRSKAYHWGTLHRVEITDGSSVEEMVDCLRDEPEVGIAEPNYLLHFVEVPYAPNDPLWESDDPGDDPRDSVFDQWSPAKLGASIVWNDPHPRGSVIVAIIDTGIRLDHEDLEPNIWINVDEIPGNGIDDDGNGWVDDWRGWDTFGGDNDPWDSESHGTGCAGIVGAVQDNERGLSGIAPWAKIMAIRADMWDGPSCVATVIEAWDYAKTNGADIVSMSFVVLYPTEALEIAAEDTWDNGNGPILMGAAGNWNNTDQYVPASYDCVICVGATIPWSRSAQPVDEDRIHVGWQGWWWGSNYGSNLEIMGFGEMTITTHSASKTAYRDGINYGFFNGTSCACPTSAGVMALIVSFHPDMGGQWYWDRIIETADDLNVPGYDIQTGYGRVNAVRAVYGPDRYSAVVDPLGFVQIPMDGASIVVDQPLFDSIHDFPGNPYDDPVDLYQIRASYDGSMTFYLDIFTWGEDLDMALYGDPEMTKLLAEATTENHADSSWESMSADVLQNTDYYLKIYSPAEGNSTTYGLSITTE